MINTISVVIILFKIVTLTYKHDNMIKLMSLVTPHLFNKAK